MPEIIAITNDGQNKYQPTKFINVVTYELPQAFGHKSMQILINWTTVLIFPDLDAFPPLLRLDRQLETINSLDINSQIDHTGNICCWTNQIKGANINILSVRGSTLAPQGEPFPAFLAKKPSAISLIPPMKKITQAKGILLFKSKISNGIAANPRDNEMTFADICNMLFEDLMLIKFTFI